MNQRKYQSIDELKATQRKLKARCKKMEHQAIDSIANPQNLLLNYAISSPLRRNKKNTFGSAYDLNGMAFGIIRTLLPLLPVKPILLTLGKGAVTSFVKVQTVNLAIRLIKNIIRKKGAGKTKPITKK